VAVDEPRRDDQTVGIDGLLSGGPNPADFDDVAVFDPDVSLIPWAA
jgi:hypothetical protein